MSDENAQDTKDVRGEKGPKNEEPNPRTEPVNETRPPDEEESKADTDSDKEVHKKEDNETDKEADKMDKEAGKDADKRSKEVDKEADKAESTAADEAEKKHSPVSSEKEEVDPAQLDTDELINTDDVLNSDADQSVPSSSKPPSLPSLPSLPGGSQDGTEPVSDFEFQGTAKKAKALPSPSKFKLFLHKMRHKLRRKPKGAVTYIDPTGRPRIKVLKSAKGLVSEEDRSRLHSIGELTFSRLWPSEYATPQKLRIHSSQFAWYRILLFLGSVWVCIYCIVVNGSYFEHDRAFGSAVLNLIGTASASAEALAQEVPKSKRGRMVFDQYDLRYPAQQKNGIFVATHVVGYKQQTRQSVYGELKTCIDPETSCPCAEGTITPFGKATGKCKKSRCEINGWCTADPAIDDNGEADLDNFQVDYDAILEGDNNGGGLESAIITFDVAVEFAKFGFSKSVSSKPIKLGRNGNAWRIGSILKAVDVEYENIKDKGIIIVCSMHWICQPNRPKAYSWSDMARGRETRSNQKLPPEKDCKKNPKGRQCCTVDWQWTRADNPATDNSGSHIWVPNYTPPRRADFMGLSNVAVLEGRHLQKLYGIKIIFNVTGESKRFDFGQFLGNIGSIVGIISVCCCLSILTAVSHSDQCTVREGSLCRFSSTSW